MLKLLTLALAALFAGSMPAWGGDRVVIGISPSLTAALNVIAKQHGYFAKQGVDAELRVIESGSTGVTMMLNDELDISESALFALVSSSFQRKDFRIYAQVSIAGNDNMIIARKDKGIRTIADLKGKRVGVLRGALPQYILDLMLLNAGLESGKIQVVLDEPGQLHRMLASGELDGVCMYGGWIDRAMRELKDNAVLFHDPALVRVTAVQAGKTRNFERNPGLYSRILKAYLEAEAYIHKNPDAAMREVVTYLKLDLGNAQKVWKPKMIHVALEQSLIKDLENLAQWQIDIGLQKGPRIPNYLDFIHFGSLAGIDPKRVTLTH